MKLYLTLVFSIIFFAQLFAQQNNCRQTDTLVLMALHNSKTNLDSDDFYSGKKSLVDPSCTISDSLNLIKLANVRNCYNWDFNKPLTNWYGIEVNSNNCVIGIDFNEEELGCKFIPAEIGNFSKLKSLIIRKNDMIGSIPPEIGKLTQLSYLNLEKNKLTGKIPDEIGNLVNLENIELSYNSLSGSLPSSIGNLTKLEKLSLTINKLSGQLPSSIGNLIRLKEIYLTFNNFSGPLPSSIGNLRELERLSILYNKFSGSVPNGFLLMDSLKLLSAGTNHFSGCFNQGFSNLCDIADFNNNNFEGSWDNFCNFGTSSCDEINPCASNDSLSLLAFYQSVNGLNWDIAKPVNTWEGVNFDSKGCVKELILPNKNLSGEISNQLFVMRYLNKVDLSNNKLNSFTNLGMRETSNIEILDLSNNVIQSELSNFTFKTKNLKHLNLSNNKIFDLSFNNFFYFTNMEYLNLSHNNLEGSINLDESDFVYNMPNLSYFNISHNNINGDFPNSFLNLCNRLLPNYNSNMYLSEGNNFNSTWEEFCNNKTSSNCPNKLYFPGNYSYIFDSHRPDTIIYENTVEVNDAIFISQKVASNASVTCKANELITLGLGTVIEASSNFSATIGDACQ